MRTTGGDYRLEALTASLKRGGKGVPVSCEADGPRLPTSLTSYWRPSWHELLRLAFGAKVRVLINYIGPLYVDVARDEGYSEGVEPADVDALRSALEESPPSTSSGE